MKEICGSTVSDELYERLMYQPDGVAYSDVSKISYSWVFDEFMPGYPNSAIYIKTERDGVIHYETSKLFSPDVDLLRGLRTETEKMIRNVVNGE